MAPAQVVLATKDVANNTVIKMSRSVMLLG
jgi:hypothetical protein